MTLRYSYSLIAPVYDALVEKATQPMRARSLERINPARDHSILINGIGTGLDVPLLPVGPSYTGTDLTAAMLRRAQHQVNRYPDVDIRLQVADSMKLPYANHSFDTVLMHLILAIVPDSVQALQEAARVTRPGGRILVLDKFLRPGQWAPVRRLINLPLRFLATKTNVVFEDVLARCPQLSLVSDEEAMAGGWFRAIDLKKL